LLTQAGYKETRVYTPESEKRIIKRTLDEDDEINALYGAFGLTPSKSSGVHPRTTITEPSLPMKSSSTLLRRLALQNVPGANDKSDAQDAWWGGGITASLGRAAKAVMDKSQAQTTDDYADALAPSEAGLGRTGDVSGLRKKTSVQKDQRFQRGVTEEPPQQEQRPPAIRSLSESPKRNPEFKPPSASVQAIMDSAPAPAAIDDGIYGYSPLPLDYEDQCDEDDAMYSAMDSFQVGSLGSSTAHSSISMAEIDGMTLNFGSGSTVRSLFDGPGQRILLNTVEYDDEFDSPTSHNLVLPSMDDESDVSDVEADPETSVSRPDIRRTSTEPEPVVQAELPKQLKYGDRATKLRMAKSTPALKHQQSGWFDSIRSAVRSRAGYPPLDAEPPMPVSTLQGPMKISPAVPVAPKLVVTSPVICDSVSTEAEDLPAIPSSITATAPKADSYVPLRLRSSLAALRIAVGLPERKAIDASTPVLSPQLDWKAQGSQFAGWNWEKDKDGGEWATKAPAPEVEGLGLGMKMPDPEAVDYDYSKSFFYKPATPPHPSHRSAPKTNDEEIHIPAGEIPRKEPAVGKRRSIKSLRAALLLPVAPPPPVPAVPALYRANSSSGLPPTTPPPMKVIPPPVEAPILAISSPGAWEAGLPPRELVLEGEEWDARDGGVPGDWGKKVRKGKKKVLKKRSCEA